MNEEGSKDCERDIATENIAEEIGAESANTGKGQLANCNENDEGAGSIKRGVIVIPTYNEKENIGILIDAIKEAMSAENNPVEPHILVVDDNSPDGTAQVVKEYGRKQDNIHLLLRNEKEGLGKAYLAGIKHAIENLNADYVITMDADLSHNPELLPYLFEKAKTHDLVIGSRYCAGGGFVNWTWTRRLISATANFLGRKMLGLKIGDISSGYRCYSRKILERIDFSEIKSKGYSFLEELLFFCARKNARIKEIPLLFRDRERGEAKLSKKEIVQFLHTLLRLSLRRGK